MRASEAFENLQATSITDTSVNSLRSCYYSHLLLLLAPFCLASGNHEFSSHDDNIRHWVPTTPVDAGIMPCGGRTSSVHEKYYGLCELTARRRWYTYLEEACKYFCLNFVKCNLVVLYCVNDSFCHQPHASSSDVVTRPTRRMVLIMSCMYHKVVASHHTNR